MTVIWSKVGADLREVEKVVDLAEQMVVRDVILDGKRVEERPLRNL